MRLPVLMKLLGHRTIGMTLRYAEITGTDVRRAYAETMAALENRYQLPAPSKRRKRSRVGSAARRFILSDLDALAASVEAYRRDHAKDSEKKPIQRLVERLRRLARDLNDVTS
jgi:hypothetical protein